MIIHLVCVPREGLRCWLNEDTSQLSQTREKHWFNRCWTQFTRWFLEHLLCAKPWLRPLGMRRQISYSVALIQLQQRAQGPAGRDESLMAMIKTHFLKIPTFEQDCGKQERLDLPRGSMGPSRQRKLISEGVERRDQSQWVRAVACGPWAVQEGCLWAELCTQVSMLKS